MSNLSKNTWGYSICILGQAQIGKNSVLDESVNIMHKVTTIDEAKELNSLFPDVLFLQW